MQAVFGPAGDQIWGDAILTDLPLRDVTKTPYPMFDSLTGAGITAATVTWHDRSIRILATHLQPDGNATDATGGQAALFAEALGSADGAVIGGGDLNTTRGSEAWRALLASGAQDAFADAAEQPEIDHLLVSGLTAGDATVVESPLSDHPMIVATFR
jgi:endonuclease/exonuclease/phosphatase family metal-dependent hydrolase